MQKQLLLPIKYEQIYSESNFIVSDCNNCAFKWLKVWPYDESNNFTCIVGDKYSGKTHLSHIWADTHGAMFLSADNLNYEKFYDTVVSSRMNRFVIDNLDSIVDDILLFHIYNFIKESGCCLLCTAITPPALWNVKLPDTHSRLATMHIEYIKNPCDAMESVIQNVLRNRGINIKHNIVEYIANRIERSYFAINKLADIIDKRLPEYGRFCMSFVKDIMIDMC